MIFVTENKFKLQNLVFLDINYKKFLRAIRAIYKC